MDTITSQLAQLESAQLVRRLTEEDWAYLFKHALTQEAAYDSLLLKRRREIHRRVAETIERLYPDQLDEQAALLARHYAECGDDARTSEFALRAADHAAHLFAYIEARHYYAQALDALGRLPASEENRRLRVDTLVKQVAVSLRADGPDPNLERLHEAERLLRSLPPAEGDREQLAYIQYWMGHAYVHRGQFAEASVFLRQVLAAAQDGVGGPELLAIPGSVIGRSLAVQGKFAEAEAMLAQAIEPLAQAGNWHEWILAVGMRAFCLAAQGQIQPAFAEAERALHKAEETGTLVGIAQGHMVLALVAMQSEEYERMKAEARENVQTAERGADRFLLWVGLNYSFCAETFLGNLTAAEELRQRALAEGEKIGRQLVFSDAYAAVGAELALRGGHFDEAIARARQAREMGESAGSLFSKGLAERVWGRALALAHSPNLGEAEEHLTASSQAFESGQAVLEAARTHEAWGQVLHACGQEAAAREHFGQALSRFQEAELSGAAERVRGLIHSLSN